MRIKYIVLSLLICVIFPLAIVTQEDFFGDAFYVNNGSMVTSPEFYNIKQLWVEIGKLNPDIVTKNKLKEYQRQLEGYIEDLEKQCLCGRWTKQFLLYEMDYLCSELIRKKDNIETKTLPEEERAITFWKELEFCNEGGVTLLTLKEYDTWLGTLLANRFRRTFKNMAGMSFKKRLEALKITADQYKDKIIKAFDKVAEYQNLSAATFHNVIIGKSKDELKNIMFRSGNEWVEHNSRKGREFFETDLIEIKSIDDIKVVLTDRRHVILEGGSFVTGWEILPNIPETLGQEIDKLIELLNNDDWETRENATKELIGIGDSVVNPLKESLNSREPEVRMRASMIIKKIEQAKDPLLQIRTVIESYMSQHQAIPLKELLQIGDINQIAKVLGPMLSESQNEMISEEEAMSVELLYKLYEEVMGEVEQNR
ncbi:MAG: HEAT repeat domain-containing protein [Planctomycetes bacterium]|nr:HEAT repeat domain-containing protein [Planctomycetota bacterium]